MRLQKQCFGITYTAVRAVLPSAAALLALLTAAAPAQQPPRDPHAVQPERPTVATHAYTVAPGWIEIEAGVEIDRYPGGVPGTAAPVVLKVGLAPRLQLDLGGTVLRPPRVGTTGIGDLSVGLKWRVLEGAPVLADFSVIPSLKLPTAPVGSGLGTGTTDVGLLLVSSRRFGPVSVDLNAGYTWRSGAGARAPRGASLWTASFGGPAVGRLGWVAELYGLPGTSGPAGRAPVVALLAGPTLLYRAWLALDAGVIVPVSGPQPRALYAGAVWNVGRP
jgi:hypothetical protein